MKINKHNHIFIIIKQQNAFFETLVCYIKHILNLVVS